MDKVIEIKNLCVTAGRRYLLQNINWSIEKGDRGVLFGLNDSLINLGRLSRISAGRGKNIWGKL